MKVTMETPSSRVLLDRKWARSAWFEASFQSVARRRTIGLLEWTEVSFAIALAERDALAPGPRAPLAPETEGIASLSERTQIPVHDKRDQSTGGR
jgi:hypothetical protein